MAYTDQWDETFPPDSELAKTLANNIRQLEKDIRERMDDVFTDATGLWSASGPANPVVPSALLKGNFAGKIITLHHSAFAPSVGYVSGSGFPGSGFAETAYTRNSAYVQGNGDVAINYFAAVILPEAPLGVSVTSVTFAIDLMNVSNTLTGKLSYTTFNSGVVTVVKQANAPSVTGFNSFTLSGAPMPFSTAIGGGTSAAIFLEIDTTLAAFAAAPKIYGAQVVYTTADCRNTL